MANNKKNKQAKRTRKKQAATKAKATELHAKNRDKKTQSSRQVSIPIWKGSIIHSDEFKNVEYWYHGTDASFDSWVFPPPKKPNSELEVPHKGMFFSSNARFAREAGKNLLSSRLSPKAKVLDTIANYEASEQLRKLIAKHPELRHSMNVEHDYWHDGWKTGAVLRVTSDKAELKAHFLKYIAHISQITNLSSEHAEKIAAHNITRGLIELICEYARCMGFDAIYGYEIDRFGVEGPKAQPWLAVLNDGYLSFPKLAT